MTQTVRRDFPASRSVMVTVKQAAYLFGVSRKTVQSWVDRNEELEPVGTLGQAYTYDYHELAEVEFKNRSRFSCKSQERAA